MYCFQMKNVNIKAAFFIAYLTLSASVSASGTLLCKVTEDFAGGWVPKTFLLALPTSEDYSDAEIILPKVHVISYAKWRWGGVGTEISRRSLSMGISYTGLSMPVFYSTASGL